MENKKFDISDFEFDFNPTKKFLTFGLMLYLLIMIMQFMLGRETYLNMCKLWYIQILLHAIILINSYFLLNGTKFYNEDIGAE